jgi:non-heme chloroperoxidase
MTPSAPKSGSVTANGIRLHYLDWGGEGPALLFLAGMGSSVHIFKRFAPRFTDKFHVLGLDRRGHGDSDYPDSGYDPDTLSEDLLQSLDALQIERVILVGHSMACVELCHFTALHPQRVLKLVFLDAAYDDSSLAQQAVWDSNPATKMWPKWPAEEPESIEAYVAAVRHSYPSIAAIWGPVMEEEVRHCVKTGPDGKVIDRMSEAEAAALRQTLRTYSPEYARLHVPVLSFFCTHDARDHVSAETMSEEQQAQVREYYQGTRQPYILKYVEQFKGTVPQARVVVIPNGHHYCFIKQEQIVFEEMRRFLLQS